MCNFWKQFFFSVIPYKSLNCSPGLYWKYLPLRNVPQMYFKLINSEITQINQIKFNYHAGIRTRDLRIRSREPCPSTMEAVRMPWHLNDIFVSVNEYGVVDVTPWRSLTTVLPASGIMYIIMTFQPVWTVSECALLKINKL